MSEIKTILFLLTIILGVAISGLLWMREMDNVIDRILEKLNALGREIKNDRRS